MNDSNPNPPTPDAKKTEEPEDLFWKENPHWQPPPCPPPAFSSQNDPPLPSFSSQILEEKFLEEDALSNLLGSPGETRPIDLETLRKALEEDPPSLSQIKISPEKWNPPQPPLDASKLSSLDPTEITQNVDFKAIQQVQEEQNVSHVGEKTVTVDFEQLQNPDSALQNQPQDPTLYALHESDFVNGFFSIGSFYIPKDPIAQGAASQVFLAFPSPSSHAVPVGVMKLAKRGREKEIFKEIDLARRFMKNELEHECFVQFLKTGVTPKGTPFLVTEYLSPFPRREITFEDAFCITTKIAQVVSYLHKNRLYHRDIKPENIKFVLWKNRIYPKLFDFGTITNQINDSQNAACSPYFAAPEVLLKIRGRFFEDFQFSRADVFSIGLSLLGFLQFNPYIAFESHIEQGFSEITSFLDRLIAIHEVHYTEWFEKIADYLHTKQAWKESLQNSFGVDRNQHQKLLQGTCSLLKQVLHTKPEKRPTASALLKQMSTLFQETFEMSVNDYLDNGGSTFPLPSYQELQTQKQREPALPQEQAPPPSEETLQATTNLDFFPSQQQHSYFEEDPTYPSSPPSPHSNQDTSLYYPNPHYPYPQENFNPSSSLESVPFYNSNPTSYPSPFYNAPYPNQNAPYPNQNAPYPNPNAPYPNPNAPYPNPNAPYPNPNAPYPNQNAPYPNPNAPYPNQNAPYPNQNAPYPNQNAPYPNQNAPYPNQNAPYPNQNAPYPPYLSDQNSAFFHEPPTSIFQPPSSAPPPSPSTRLQKSAFYQGDPSPSPKNPETYSSPTPPPATTPSQNRFKKSAFYGGEDLSPSSPLGQPPAPCFSPQEGTNPLPKPSFYEEEYSSADFSFQPGAYPGDSVASLSDPQTKDFNLGGAGGNPKLSYRRTDDLPSKTIMREKQELQKQRPETGTPRQRPDTGTRMDPPTSRQRPDTGTRMDPSTPRQRPDTGTRIEPLNKPFTSPQTPSSPESIWSNTALMKLPPHLRKAMEEQQKQAEQDKNKPPSP
jgi:serine/threonine protein kinase